ncbi:uncharacterized protein LOC116205990 [Punica granatum]|uniref:Hepatoma-derived growth factor-related protein 2-like n=2 Tax=Punica granatum TaxID=22663 RepID=A0A218VXM4_PUNGR|nr:uncharacterized protein LOC116205990 [Punica granatum]OWM65029.1 hypothetical protein CDL15_Pgr028747 [Punica granatum]PKI44041.1 hypothetical protein CRG98_035571 [Punica granatum]
MADFSSDTDDSSAVEELISQTRDLCVLEQVAAINCSGFSDSPLPPDLDSRFRRLKSFPLTKPHSSAPPGRQRPEAAPTDRNGGAKFEEEKSESSSASADGGGRSKQSCSRSVSFPVSSNFEDFEEGKRVSKLTGKSGKIKETEKERKLGILTPSDSSDSSMEDDIFSPSELNIEEKSRSRSKSKSKLGSASSPLGSSRSWMNSPSPPRKTGCFWCSPKKASPKIKSKENRVKGMSFDWSQQDDILSDLGIFSKKEQQKMLKKAMKEEERISREAEKIVRMAKQASARMTVTSIEDELGDDDSPKHI